MNKYSLKAIFWSAVWFVATAVMPCADLAQVGAQEKQDLVQLLFVQNGNSGSFDGKTLTLKGIGPTLFFSDRPQRIVGHLHTSEFISHWDKGSDNFAENPPNATLSIFGQKEVSSIVVVLTGPSLKRDTLAYKVKVLSGKLPATFKESSLFIDILGRWRMAAMGMAVGEARGMAMGSAMARSQYYHPAPPPPPAAAPAGPVYTAPAPPAVNVTVTTPPAQTSGQADAVQKLKQLKSLLNQGLITQGQYQEESQKILNQLVQ